MGIVLGKSKPLLLGSYGKKMFFGHNSAIFVLEQYLITVTLPKVVKLIGFSEENFYSKIDF